MDPEYLKDRKVFGHVLAAFRYGREDLVRKSKTMLRCCEFFCLFFFFPTLSGCLGPDLPKGPLPGLRTNLPPAGAGEGPAEEAAQQAAGRSGKKDYSSIATLVLILTLFAANFQERLIKKLGENAYPFFFELPPHCPASVTLQPAPGDTG